MLYCLTVDCVIVFDNLRHILSDDGVWQPQYITVFQFIWFFRDKLLSVFVESLAHETWIIESLKQRNVCQVRAVMERLKLIPVLPPFNCLRYVSMILVDKLIQLHAYAEGYLLHLQGLLHDEVISVYVTLLEHDDPLSRRGACRALAVLNAKQAAKAILFVSNHDHNVLVRDEARRTLMTFGLPSDFMISSVPAPRI
ncbi:unnamed protein product [Soboliphyme baturini]|uniref:Uncharacterized protein n=1 Tax=Soboliphyme baturini TaxID=241478 RepID=A0A3P8DU63_9BILA|nr:unnamed protein product [Soboliphyme baturini]